MLKPFPKPFPKRPRRFDPEAAIYIARHIHAQVRQGVSQRGGQLEAQASAIQQAQVAHESQAFRLAVARLEKEAPGRGGAGREVHGSTSAGSCLWNAAP